MKLIRSVLLSVAAIAMGGLALFGCGSDSVGPSGNSTSLVRSINALQACPANIDIAQQNVQPATATNLSYALAPTGYVSIRSGNGLNYAVYPTGSTTNPLTTTSIDLSPHDSNGNANTGTYTLVVTGLCSGGSGDTTPRLVRLVDAFPSNFTGGATGTVAIRLVNLIPDYTGTISLYSNGAALNGGDNSGTNSVPYAVRNSFDGTHYNGGIALVGSPTLTIVNNANQTLATLNNVSFPANHAYTLFAIGEVNPVNGGQAVRIVAVQDF